MGRSVLVSWDAPTSYNGTIPDGIEKYIIQTDFGEEYSSVEVDAVENTFLFENIEEGEYTVEIMSVNSSGQKSPTYAESIYVPPVVSENDFATTVDSIPIGGTINCPTFFRGTSNDFVFYIQQHDWTFKSPLADSNAITNLSGIESTYKQNLSNVPITPNVVSDTQFGAILPDAYYILLSEDDALDKLRLIKLESRYEDPFWFDAGSGEKSAIVGTSNSSYGVALTGTITVKGSRVEGEGTDFIGELEEGDVLFGTSSTGGDYLGRVQTIYSDTSLKLDNTRGMPGEDHSFGRVNLRVNRLQDSIIARVFRTSSNVFEHEIYTTLDNTLTASLSPTSESSNLIAHYTFDSMINNKVVGVNRKVSNFVADVVGAGASITSESPIGNAILLNGNQYVRLLRDNFAYRHTANSGGDFVVWFRSDTTSGENNALIIGRKDFWSLQLNQSGSGDQTISLVDETTGSTLLSSIVSQGVWHQAALSTDDYTEENRYKAYLYVDRIPLASIDEDHVLLPNNNSEPDGNILLKPLTLGGWASGDNGFVGAFTDVWIPNKSLSDSQIGSLWSRQGTENAASGRPLIMGEGVNSIQVDENGIIVGGTDTSDAPFSVTTAGAIDATSGEVAGWKLSASSIYSGASPQISGYASEGFTLRKTGSVHSKNFYIDNNGDAFFRGKVSASSGEIGGWQIHDQGIYSSNLGGTLANAQNIPATGFLTNEGIVIHNQGSLHSKNFFINSDGSSSFAGDISGATGTFSGGAGEGTITGSEIQDGSVDANELASEGIAGYNISPTGTIAVFNRAGGNIIPSSYAALDGADSDFRLYAGSDNPRLAPFRVTKEGQITADNLQLFDANNNIYFDSNTGGFTPSALTKFARDMATRIKTATDLFTGNKDNSDNSTFQQIILTENTEVVTSLAIPTAKLASKVSEEYFGNRSNPLTITLDVSSLGASGTSSLTRAANIKKPNGDSLSRAVKVGELVRFNLENTVSGMAVTAVTGAINALTGSAFSSNYNIAGPAKFGYLLFEISGTATDFTFTISSANTANIVMDAEVSANNSAKPDTETAARADLPTAITYGLNRSTVSAEDSGSLTQVIAPVTVNRITSGTPTSAQYLAKTLSKDIVDVDTIHSTVAVVPGGAVNSEGFINSSDDTETLSASSYFYHSTLSFTGGDSNFYPQNRLFKITSNSLDFVASSGEGPISQSSQNTTINDLTISGQTFTPHATTITPAEVSGSAGTVTISGNLHVTGTQTTVTQQDLTISDKHITLADGATVAGDIHTAGIIVDRTGITQPDASIAWNETNDEWEISNKVSSGNFRSTNDGTSTAPAFTFSNRSSGTSATGFWASNQVIDTETHDQINVTTQTHSDGVATSYFNISGITSSYNVYTAENAAFRNLNGTWQATTGTSTGDFKFTNTTGGNTVPIMYLSSQFKRVGIGTTQPQYQLEVQHNAPNVARFESTTSSASIVIKSPSGSSKHGKIVFDNTTASDTLVLKSTSSNTLEIRKEGTTANSFFKFKDGTTEAAVTIDKLGDFEQTTPRIQDATLHLTNSDTTTITGSYSGYRGSSVVFSSYMDAATPVAQRGYISCGPTENGKGYGYMAFGVQKEEEPSVTDSGTQLYSTLYINPGNRIGINNNRPLSTLDIRGSHTGLSNPAITLRSNVGAQGGIVGTLRFFSEEVDGAEANIRGIRYSDDVVLDFFTRSDRRVLRLQKDGQLTIGYGSDNSEGHVNMENNSLLSLEASFSSGHAANSEQILHLFHAGARAAKVLAHVDEVGTTFTSELTILMKGSDVYATEYGVVISDGTTKNVKFEVDYAGGFARLKAVNISGGTKYLRLLITMLGYG